MIWLRTDFHGDDQRNRLRTTRNLFRNGLFKKKEKEQTDAKRTEMKKKDKGTCLTEKKKDKQE